MDYVKAYKVSKEINLYHTTGDNNWVRGSGNKIVPVDGEVLVRFYRLSSVVQQRRFEVNSGDSVYADGQCWDGVMYWSVKHNGSNLVGPNAWANGNGDNCTLRIDFYAD